jgi:hypothetical protein
MDRYFQYMTRRILPSTASRVGRTWLSLHNRRRSRMSGIPQMPLCREALTGGRTVFATSRQTSR